MERIGSEITDDSPFSSNLTTPVDEDVPLFLGVKSRLLTEEGLGMFSGLIDNGHKEAAISKLHAAKTTELGITPSVVSTGTYFTAEKETLCERQSEETQLLLSPEPDEYAHTFEPEIGELYDMLSDDGSCSNAENKSDHSTKTLFSELPFATNIPDFDEPEADSASRDTVLSNSELGALIPFLLRFVYFLPWCVLVGGTIVLSPWHLNLVAFGPGYIQPVPVPGLRRFQHWTTTGREFVGIFLGFVVSVCWVFPWFGLLFVPCILARAAYAWADFVFVEKRHIKLGRDDQESLWVILTDNRLSIREGRRGWYVGTCLKDDEELK